MKGLNTIVKFSENDKWFIISEKEIDNAKYSYLVKINKEENDILDEYKVVRCYSLNGEEYMDDVNDKDLLNKIIPILIPEANEYIQNPEKLKELLEENTSN